MAGETMTDFGPLPWHVVEDADGYQSVHYADEEPGLLGDIVCTTYQDEKHANLIAAAPDLLAAIQAFLTAKDEASEDGFNHAEAYQFLCKGGSGRDAQDAMRAALSRAQGADR